jgi:hypothetical protein
MYGAPTCTYAGRPDLFGKANCSGPSKNDHYSPFFSAILVQVRKSRYFIPGWRHSEFDVNITASVQFRRPHPFSAQLDHHPHRHRIRFCFGFLLVAEKLESVDQLSLP